MDKLTTGVKKTPLGYMGYLQCWNGRALNWTVFTKINRPTAPSAKIDADNLKKDLIGMSIIT
jgi:hypothetical protein